MSGNQTSRSSQELAVEFTERFGFRKKIEDIFNEKDENLIPILTANIAIFGVAFTIFFSTKESNLTASVLLIGIAAFVSLVGALLNIWYLVRLKKRMEFLRKEQKKVFDKAEANLVKAFDFFKKIGRASIADRAEILLNKSSDKDELMEGLKNDRHWDFLAEDGVFIPLTTMELALAETSIKIRQCLNEPLDETHAATKLFIDQFSDKSKTWGLTLGSTLMLAALLVKFIVG